MIYVGPEEKDIEELANELSFETTMSRTCFELKSLEQAMQDLESLLVTTPALVQDKNARELLQSIDPIQQSLAALSKFIGLIPKPTKGGKISIESALKEVHLNEMRNRLGK